MAQFMGDVCARVGEFEANGQTKARYLKVGSWFQDDQGRVSVKLLAMPLVPDPKTGVGCWLSLMHKQDNDQQQGQSQQQRQTQPQQQRQSPPQQQRGGYQRPSGEDEVPF